MSNGQEKFIVITILAVIGFIAVKAIQTENKNNKKVKEESLNASGSTFRIQNSDGTFCPTHCNESQRAILKRHNSFKDKMITPNHIQRWTVKDTYI